MSGGCLSPLAGLRLLLPAIVPSWRFFDAVTGSPRLDYALLAGADEAAAAWEAFRPRAAMLTPGTMLRRLVWNAQWNEDLFLVSLAERLLKSESAASVAHSQRELLLRVARHLDRTGGADRRDWLQLRLRIVRRAGASEEVDSDIVYLSSPWPMAELLTA